MKKLYVIILVALMMFFIPASALTQEVEPLAGVILELYEDGSFLMESETMGQVMVDADEACILEGLSAPAVGLYVFVAYDGVITKSLPAQIQAEKISCFRLQGTVLSVDEISGTILIDAMEYGEVIVKLPKMEEPLAEGDYVTVYYSGLMALSYPAQAGALKVDTYEQVSGTIDEIAEGYFLLSQEDGVLQVNVGDETEMPEMLEVGDAVKVYHNGQTLFTAPPQVFGVILIPHVTE